jgi:hypothetical protein
MKTQINNLRSGTKNQILNPEINYKNLPQATSHVGHSGSNRNLVNEFTDKLKAENKENMRILFFGQEIELKANWSLSSKSCNWSANLPKEIANNFFILSKTENPSIIIQDANSIQVFNGGNSNRYVCPSLIEII